MSKIVLPDAILAAIVGDGPMLRDDVVRRLWKYIQDKGLNVRTKSQMLINADEKLKPFFAGKDQVPMIEMNYLLQDHLTDVQPPGPT